MFLRGRRAGTKIHMPPIRRLMWNAHGTNSLDSGINSLDKEDSSIDNGNKSGKDSTVNAPNKLINEEKVLVESELKGKKRTSPEKMKTLIVEVLRLAASAFPEIPNHPKLQYKVRVKLSRQHL